MKRNFKATWVYFLLVYTLSWLFWLPEVLAPQGISENKLYYVLYLAGGFGPSISAFILTYIYEGKKGIKQLWGRGFDFKIKKVWYIIIFTLMPIILGISLLIYVIVGETIPESILLSNPLLILPVFIIIFFFQGAISEEFGWRGFALDRLQKKYNALVSSIILGVLWGIWHLPLFFISGTSQSKMPLLLIIFFMLNSILLSIIFTWLHNNTGGNIMVALLFHTMINLSYGLIQLTTTYVGFLIVVIVTLIIDIAIVAIWHPHKMTRIKKIQ